MKLSKLAVAGAYVATMERLSDERGSYVRGWRECELAEHGLSTRFVQSNISHSNRKGTMRGLHRQRAPYHEEKFIFCTRGKIFDIVVDARPESDSYGRWVGIELDEDNDKAVFVPKGCFHGFITLVDDSSVFYTSSCEYNAEAEEGIRFDDPIFNIQLPISVKTISEKDLSWPAYLLDTRY